MDKIKEWIDNGIISQSDIEEYLYSIGYDIIQIERLHQMEETLNNHPG